MSARRAAPAERAPEPPARPTCPAPPAPRRPSALPLAALTLTALPLATLPLAALLLVALAGPARALPAAAPAQEATERPAAPLRAAHTGHHGTLPTAPNKPAPAMRGEEGRGEDGRGEEGREGGARKAGAVDPSPPAPPHTAGPHGMNHEPGMEGMMEGMAATQAMPHHPPVAAAGPGADGAADAPPGDETTTESIGDAPPPPVPTDHPADRFFPADRMAAARSALLREGRFSGRALLVDELEYRALAGRDGIGWKGEAWSGGDIDRLVLASEGESAFGKAAERIELRALWRHAVAPYFNLEAGLRQDFRPGPQRRYALIGLDGLAPYWFDVEAQLLLSDHGEARARLEGRTDLRLTNRLILQPAAEVDIAFQDMPDQRIGAGPERIEAGLRLRYEIRRQVAPYVGLNWDRRLGRSARMARADGDRASALGAVAGLRLWF